MRWLAVILGALALALAGCGGGEEAAPTAETVEGTVPTETGGGGGGGAGGGDGGAGGGGADGGTAKGDPAAGKEIFTAQGCGSCHTFGPAGTSGTTGPNLDESLEGDDAEHVRESILDPNADVEEGFPSGVMPEYEGKLSDKQVNDLVALLTQS